MWYCNQKTKNTDGNLNTQNAKLHFRVWPQYVTPIWSDAFYVNIWSNGLSPVSLQCIHLWNQRWCIVNAFSGTNYDDALTENQTFQIKKANLRDLIAATCLVISNWVQIVDFSLCDLAISWMTSKNNRALLLHVYYVKLCASFQIHRWIQTGEAVWKRWIGVQIGDILSHVTLKFGGWHWKTTGHLFYITSSFVRHFKSIGEVKLELQSGNA